MAVVHEQVGGEMEAAEDVGAAGAVCAVGEDVGLCPRGGDAGLERAVDGDRGGEELVGELEADLVLALVTDAIARHLCEVS